MVKHILILPNFNAHLQQSNTTPMKIVNLLVILKPLLTLVMFRFWLDADLTTGSTLLTRGWLPFLPRRATEGATTKN